MMRVFVNFYWYDHGKKRKLLSKMFKAGLCTRSKQFDWYLYTER